MDGGGRRFWRLRTKARVCYSKTFSNERFRDPDVVKRKGRAKELEPPAGGEEEVIRWISPILEGFLRHRGYELYEVTYRRERVGWVLRVTVDRIGGGLTVGETRELSREIGAILDSSPETERLLPGPYHLEVSSPGIFRPLKTRRDYERAWNRRVKIQVEGEEGRIQEVVGFVRVVEEGGVGLECGGRMKRFSWEKIVGGQLFPELPF